VLLLYTV